ncbi:FAD-dependent oxidoreductase [Carboxylicivirga marina]|uniref:FAD-dependent oxidoreductase n=1 Tax=Carboxylicivirga marina TaxID=2800988 RepID=A0ABS1HN15_9BACT|nr:FAD-dependent oxidoreductase [Carboxylicivirga marina]MBK3519016.1 FAD-dependent oxidoreductase [Carboxylicivirga marina]
MRKESIKEFKTHSIQAEFCVVGGGMAGVCAALSAARNGIKTVLVQDRPVLGGNASSEVRMWVCGADGPDNKETGILEELMLKNFHENPMLEYAQWDHVLYGTCMEQENLTVMLNCSVMDVATKINKIQSVKAWHMTQQCYYDITAAFFADCSGDSVLKISGAKYRWGRESKEEYGEKFAQEVADDKTMGSSILIQLRETDLHVPFIAPSWAHSYTDETAPKRALNPQNGHNFWWLEFGGTKDTIAEADEIRDELLKTAYGVWEYIKNHPDGRAKNWEIDWIGSLPGKRENIRYVGDHTLIESEVMAEGKFDDMVAYGGWPMDNHHPQGVKFEGDPTDFNHSPSPYGIPYRSLYSCNIDNLFFAGRNISASHMAMSSTRVMATCSLMGHAIGHAASIAIKQNLSPRGVYENAIPQLQQLLMEKDCYLPWHTRKIPELSLKAELTASCDDASILHDGTERDTTNKRYGFLDLDPDSEEGRKRNNGVKKIDHGWWGDVGDWVAYTWEEPQTIKKFRLVLDSDLFMDKRMLCKYPKGRQPKQMPAMLLRDFDIEIVDESGVWTKVFEVRDNAKRFIELFTVKKEVRACKLKVIRTWGDQKAHVFAFDVSENEE